MCTCVLGLYWLSLWKLLQYSSAIQTSHHCISRTSFTWQETIGNTKIRRCRGRNISVQGEWRDLSVLSDNLSLVSKLPGVWKSCLSHTSRESFGGPEREIRIFFNQQKGLSSDEWHTNTQSLVQHLGTFAVQYHFPLFCELIPKLDLFSA